MNNDLFKTNASVEAVGAVFNVEVEDLAKFIKNYLEGQDIEGVRSVVFTLTDNDRLAGIAFIDPKSTAILGARLNAKVAKKIADKVEDTSDVRFTQEAYKTLLTVSGDNVRSTVQTVDKERQVCVRLNEGLCLSLYLAANPRHYKLKISEVGTIGKREIATVLKIERSENQHSSDSGNPYVRAAERMTRHG